MDPHAERWASPVFDGIEDALEGADGVFASQHRVAPFTTGQARFSPREKAEFRTFLAEGFDAGELQPHGSDPFASDSAGRYAYLPISFSREAEPADACGPEAIARTSI